MISLKHPVYQFNFQKHKTILPVTSKEKHMLKQKWTYCHTISNSLITRKTRKSQKQPKRYPIISIVMPFCKLSKYKQIREISTWNI